ncbi:eCIS core domain-containing protein [Actinoplanes regularis]|uniref:Phage-related protein n=1 Tax=Actinoplanes regularis TaxID=52697 RepID=A0A239FN78_9ACTN|nr:DUF4157 domain-containing protein [Actinoplanes regularis]GIE89663.1 hypothetical protein Are01nite_61430 [Actinoplanes regularis]SNS57683.1 Phage-related protein [Actinoplanes regularis]
MKLSTRQAPPQAAREPHRPAPAASAVPACRHTGPTVGNAAIHRMVRDGAVRGDLSPFSAGGGRALQRLCGPGRPVATRLTVSQPHDPAERQAEAVAARVTSGAPVPAFTGRAAAVSRAPAADDPGGDLPAALSGALRDPGPGAPLPAAVRAQVEPHLGVDLSAVRVHSEEPAAAAAAQLSARAFTTGTHIYLGAGESADDVALIAHEATHVAQQAGGTAAVGPLYREGDGILPDIVLGAVTAGVRALPGYTVLTVVAGYDPIANRTVDRNSENVVRGVLGLVPFGTAVADKVIELDVVQRAGALVDDGLTAHRLTRARIQGDLDGVWADLSIVKGIDGNVAVIAGRVAKLYQDALGLARAIIDAVVQLVRDAAVGLAEKYLVGKPAWDLAKKVLHHDPLRGTAVEATPVEILADFLTLIGKADAVAQMRERGTLQKTADWLAARIDRFRGLITQLGALFAAGWEAIQPRNIAALPDNLSRLAEEAIGLLRQVTAFGTEVIGTVLQLIKDALLGWLSQHAHAVRGFRLLTVVLGENPFTKQDVARTAENLIGGFVALLPGGEQTYQKLAEAGVIAEAGAQVETAMGRLGVTPELIVETFRAVWDSLTLEDLLNPIGAFARVLERFDESLSKIVAFAGEVVKIVIALILKLMDFPSELLGSIIANAMAAIEDIKRDPVAFLLNMIAALKSGFLNFLDKVLGYLLTGLADWLFRGLGALGIKKPPDLSFKSILELVLQVLDITADKLWTKLGKHVGEDVVAKIRAGVAMAGEAFDFVKDVQENGVGAIWTHLESQLGNLWDTLLDMAENWIVTTIIEKATVKLLSMLDPTGIMAVINSSIAFFNAVQSVIEYVREILAIVSDYVSTLAAVAAGNISAGAAKVEKGLAAAVPVAIGFLANQAGLGNVPKKLVEMIGGLRELVDRALDWLFEQAVQLGKSALAMFGSAPSDGPEAAPPLVVDRGFDDATEHHRLTSDNGGRNLVAHSAVIPINTIQDQEIQELATLYYHQVDTYDRLRATPASTGIEQARTDVNATIDLIIQRLTILGITLGPGADSPGLGEVRPYREQTTRVRKSMTWSLEAEHVVPNGYFNAVLEGMGMDRINREGEYQHMYTVLIYEGAAKLKTRGPKGPDEGDTSVIGQLKTWARQKLHQIQADDTKLNGPDHAPVGDWKIEFSKFRGKIIDRIEAVDDRTLEKMRIEQQANGHLRGHPKGDASLIDTLAPNVKMAKDQQLDMFNTIFVDRLDKLADKLSSP